MTRVTKRFAEYVMFQSHRVRKGDFNKKEVIKISSRNLSFNLIEWEKGILTNRAWIATKTARCWFQSHRVRKGDFNGHQKLRFSPLLLLLHEFQSHRVRKGDFNRYWWCWQIGQLGFQSHRVRKGDFNAGRLLAVLGAAVEFQSHRVRKGDFNPCWGYRLHQPDGWVSISSSEKRGF